MPKVEAPVGSRSSGVRRDSPEASASSTTARRPSLDRSQRARTGRSMGSVAATSCHSQPPAASTDTSVPSPPSASGDSSTVSCGRARRQPSAIAHATATGDSDPLNESGAIRTVRAGAAHRRSFQKNVAAHGCPSGFSA